MATLLVNIDVPDLESGIAFYTSAFELQLGRRLGNDFAELLGAPAPIYLLQQPAGSSPLVATPRRRSAAGSDYNAPTQRAYSRHWTPVHLDFAVPDIDAACTRALAAGATQESAIGEHAYGKLVLLSDPFGHGVCLLQFNAAGYDAIATSGPNHAA
jgi:catechol 2,3-dioxygenase-like lactoylglutathione lyase family enzyme